MLNLPSWLFVAVGFAQPAADWSSYSAAFPMFPCQDGWMGCVVADHHMSPELQQDSAGRRIPANARIGWFDLRATPSFSPFTGLSEYGQSADPTAVDAEGEDAL